MFFCEGNLAIVRSRFGRIWMEKFLYFMGFFLKKEKNYHGPCIPFRKPVAFSKKTKCQYKIDSRWMGVMFLFFVRVKLWGSEVCVLVYRCRLGMFLSFAVFSFCRSFLLLSVTPLFFNKVFRGLLPYAFTFYRLVSFTFIILLFFSLFNR